MSEIGVQILVKAIGDRVTYNRELRERMEIIANHNRFQAGLEIENNEKEIRLLEEDVNTLRGLS